MNRSEKYRDLGWLLPTYPQTFWPQKFPGRKAKLRTPPKLSRILNEIPKGWSQFLQLLQLAKKSTACKQTSKPFRIAVFHKYKNLVIISRTMHYLFSPMP